MKRDFAFLSLSRDHFLLRNIPHAQSTNCTSTHFCKNDSNFPRSNLLTCNFPVGRRSPPCSLHRNRMSHEICLPILTSIFLAYLVLVPCVISRYISVFWRWILSFFPLNTKATSTHKGSGYPFLGNKKAMDSEDTEKGS